MSASGYVQISAFVSQTSRLISKRFTRPSNNRLDDVLAKLRTKHGIDLATTQATPPRQTRPSTRDSLRKMRSSVLQRYRPKAKSSQCAGRRRYGGPHRRRVEDLAIQGGLSSPEQDLRAQRTIRASDVALIDHRL
jgi:hypothetical protein